MLADGDVPSFVAHRMGTTQAAVKDIGRAYGYPQNRTQIKAVAERLRAGNRDDGRHAGPLPGCPWPPEEPAGQQSTSEPPTPAHTTEGVSPTAVAVAEEYSAYMQATGNPQVLPGPTPDDNPASGGAPGEPEPADPGDAARILDGAAALEATVSDAALAADTTRILQILAKGQADPTLPSGRATLGMPLGRLVDADGRETLLGHAVVTVELDQGAVLDALSGHIPQARAVRVVAVEQQLTSDGRDAIRQLASLLTDGGDERS